LTGRWRQRSNHEEQPLPGPPGCFSVRVTNQMENVDDGVEQKVSGFGRGEAWLSRERESTSHHASCFRRITTQRYSPKRTRVAQRDKRRRAAMSGQGRTSRALAKVTPTRHLTRYQTKGR